MSAARDFPMSGAQLDALGHELLKDRAWAVEFLRAHNAMMDHLAAAHPARAAHYLARKFDEAAELAALDARRAPTSQGD